MANNTQRIRNCAAANERRSRESQAQIQSVDTVQPETLERSRAEAHAMVADVVAGALETDRQERGDRLVRYAVLKKRAGRNISRSVQQILAERDTKISTLSDVATALGMRLRVSFEEE